MIATDESCSFPSFTESFVFTAFLVFSFVLPWRLRDLDVSSLISAGKEERLFGSIILSLAFSLSLFSVHLPPFFDVTLALGLHLPFWATFLEVDKDDDFLPLKFDNFLISP